MHRASWLLVLLLAAACSDDAPQAGAQSEASQQTHADLPWPVNALPALKALYAGSWVPSGPEGFDEQWIDEAALVETYTKRRAGRRIWRGLRSADGVIPLDLLIRDRQGPAVAYVYVLNYRRPEDPFAAMDLVEIDDAPAVLHIRYRGRAKVLFDGVVVLDLAAPPAGEVNSAQALVTLTDGFDVVLVKVGRGSPDLGDSMEFELRLSDLQGEPIPMQGWNTMRTSDVPSELKKGTEEDGSGEETGDG